MSNKLLNVPIIYRHHFREKVESIKEKGEP